MKIISPATESIYLVDPDVPTSRRIPLAVSGAARVEWESDSLLCRAENGRDFVLAAEGRHRIVAIDRKTGRQAEAWISIRSL